MVGALLAACLILAFLQYRWTGELSRAETARLSASLRARLQQLARAFDSELHRTVQALVPAGEAVIDLGPERANEERLRNAELDRPLFRRIAAAVPDRSSTLQFFVANIAEQRFLARDWPASQAWQTLRTRLQGIARGESPRAAIVDASTALIEVPVFADGREREWMLFELDTEYAAKTFLPDLVRNYLNSDEAESFRVGVTWRSNPASWIYLDPPGEPLSGTDAEASFFPARFLGRGDRQQEGRWLVRVSHRSGSVPAAVQSAHRRNLAVAFVLLALIVAAGAALVHNTRQAKRLAAAQSQFLAGISHELRTPLTVIQGAGHNLLSGVVTDDAHRENYLRAIVKQSGQLNEMVEQLLVYGTMGKEQQRARLSSAPLDVAVSEAIEATAPELERSGRSIDVDMPADLPPVCGDAVSLRRVFGNLILNAIRHGGGEVRVTARQVGTMVDVRVADGGPGIPSEELRQVFDPFFRGKRARAGRTRGTGLGLSLVKEVVEKIGGRVEVESQTGEGTAFTVQLPIAS